MEPKSAMYVPQGAITINQANAAAGFGTVAWADAPWSSATSELCAKQGPAPIESGPLFTNDFQKAHVQASSSSSHPRNPCTGTFQQASLLVVPRQPRARWTFDEHLVFWHCGLFGAIWAFSVLTFFTTDPPGRVATLMERTSFSGLTSIMCAIAIANVIKIGRGEFDS